MPAADTTPSALMKAATPDLYRRNAFRLTGLMVTASAREVARQADKLKMLAEIGGHAAQQLTVLPGAQPPTVEEVREAMQKLKDLEARAVDEFFWFWPQDWEKPDDDAALAELKRNDLDAAFALWVEREAVECPIASHNLAVLFHMRALEWASIELHEILNPADRETQVKYWRESFDRWEWLAGDDHLWDAFKGRIRQINDAALTTGFARRLRTELPKAFDQINAQLALEFAKQDRPTEAEWHVTFLKSTHSDDDDAEGTLDAVLVPVRQSLERHLESAQAGLRKDKLCGIANAKKLLASAVPLHRILCQVRGSEADEVIEMGDTLAGAALNCAVAGYNTGMEAAGEVGGTQKAASADAFLAVLNDTLPLATDPELVSQIKTNIKTARTNHLFDSQVRPLMDRLLAISKLAVTPETKLNSIREEILPKLDGLLAARVLPPDQINELCDNVAILIRSLGIDANNDYSRPDVAQVAIKTALKYVRDDGLRSKLIEDQSTLSQNSLVRSTAGLQGSSTSPGDSSSSGCLVLVAIGVLAAVINQCNNSKSTSSNTSAQDKEEPRRTSAAAPRKLSKPSLPLPATGVLQPARSSYSTGPLTISTRYGSGNFYAKLVNESTDATVVTMFIRDGQSITDVEVPSGTYALRYACGEKWYGTTELFGEDTTYNKADSTFTFSDGKGYRVELYKQQFGNLSTSTINKDNF